MKPVQQPIPEVKLIYSSGTNIDRQPRIRTSLQAYRLLKKRFDPDTLQVKEEMLVAFLNRSNNLIGVHRLSSGGIAGTVVDVRLVLSIALKCLASSIIVAHNHPSGECRPSEIDILLTMKMKQAAELMDVKLLDHLIITIRGYYSFRDKGFL